MGESLAKTGEAKQPRLRKLLKDRAMRALRGALGGGRGQRQSAEASPVSALEGPWPAPGPPASPFCSEPSKASVMGEGQTVLLGLRMKRPGEGKGFLGERQEEEKGLEGEGGTQVPVYTARWGLGAAGWPGCGEGERAQSELGGWSWAQGLPSDNSAPARAQSTGLERAPKATCDDGADTGLLPSPVPSPGPQTWALHPKAQTGPPPGLGCWGEAR